MEWVAALFNGVSVPYLCQVFLTVLPIWLLGAVTGYLLPRPKFFSATSLLLTGTGLRNAILACHGFFIFREVWYKITDPGTFRRFCKAVLLWVCGQGWHFDFPSSDKPSIPAVSQSTADSDAWYVTAKDLAFFQYHGEGTGATQGAGPWEVMMDKEIDGVMKYTAWRRVLPSGKTEYKSCTVSADSTAEEYMDLFLDDDFRPQWDGMISSHEIAEHGCFAQRQQVVRWTRKFPFSFITSRQYTIARRFFQQGSDLYGITKAIDHPSASGDLGVVSVDVFYSMWRARTVACPWGSGKPASETLLLHHEQLKVPENLARFAVRHGMWGVVKKMAAEHPRFIAARRAKGVLPTDLDPNAYGSGFQPNPPMLRLHDSCLSLSSMASSSSDTSSELDSACGAAVSSRGKASTARKLRGFAAFAIASSLAMLVGRKGKSEGGAPEGRRRMSRSTSMASGMSVANRSHSQRYRFSSLEPMTE